MTAIILEVALASVIIIGFAATTLCACACRMSGRISREEGRGQ
ncbi:hypothetical protein [Rhizobium sp. P40RR-XXII]|nr:hypothetical protein [Rhizobium sp. P40RR-XXII]